MNETDKTIKILRFISKILITANILCGLVYVLAGSWLSAVLCFICAGFMLVEAHND